MQRRGVKTAKSGKPANELKGRDVVDEPPAGKRGRGRTGKYPHVNDEDLKAKALAIADGRADLSKKDHAMYRELKNRGLLEETFGPKKRRGMKTLKTPDFVFKFYPDAPKRLPREAVERLNGLLKEIEEGRYGDFKDKHKRAVYFWINNFPFTITYFIPTMPEEKRKTKYAELYKTEKFNQSGLKKGQTPEEFLETAKKVLEECGLSYEKAGELSGTMEGSIYVLPAFLKLLEMGYKVYPDLSA